MKAGLPWMVLLGVLLLAGAAYLGGLFQAPEKMATVETKTADPPASSAPSGSASTIFASESRTSISPENGRKLNSPSPTDAASSKAHPVKTLLFLAEETLFGGMKLNKLAEGCFGILEVSAKGF